MAGESDEWAAVRPSRVSHGASLRAAATGAGLLIAVVLVSVSLRPGSPVILYEGWNQVPDYTIRESTAVPIGSACESCMTRILKNKPWEQSAYLDPEMAMSCVRGDCRKASDAAMKSAEQDVDAELHAQSSESTMTELAAASRGADTTSMEQFYYDEKALDQEQLALNWKRAQTFARYFGKPDAKRMDLVMTHWVPPLDPAGRPVPSWLTFEPTTMNSAQIASAAQTANTLQQEGSSESVWTPPHSLAATTQSLAEAEAKPADAASSPPQNCLEQTSCHSCTGNGCHWCGGGSICAVQCPAAFGAVTYTKMEQCGAHGAVLAPQTAASSTEKSAKVEGAGVGAAGGAAEETGERQRRNREQLKDLVFLSRHTAGNTLVNTDAAVEFKLRAEDVHPLGDSAGPTLAQALAPLNEKQTAVNRRRQMLYFRMETDIHPGEAAGRLDNFAKPTTTWSLIGRPMTGWLHWGDDNDGGYFNPVGGSYWDPSVVNPAANKGSFGPAVNAYEKRHPHPADEEASMAGGALFGT